MRWAAVWHECEAAIRQRIQSEHLDGNRQHHVRTLLRLTVVGGLFVAALAYPTATIGALSAKAASDHLRSLPLKLADVPSPQTTKLLSSSGELIAYFYDENRNDVRLSHIAPVMRHSIISIEDARFYHHGALDVQGTLRALVNNATDGSTQGGSTITQQLAKLLSVQQSTTKAEAARAVAQSPARKLRELKLAIQYEDTHTKDQILEKYLNTAYYGGGAHGIAAASSHYFSRTPDKLTTVQAALLAGLVKNPVAFDPVRFPDAAKTRRNTVLRALARDGHISKAEADRLSGKPVKLTITDYPNGCVASVASFSCDYVRRYLLAEPALGATVAERQQALTRGGLTIESNIDIRFQEAANKAVASHVRPTDRAIGALAMIEPGTGKVRGVAQSRPMGNTLKNGESYIDYAVPTAFGDSGGFQAGSTFKFFTVAAALTKGISVGQAYNAAHTMTIPAGSYFDCDHNGTGPWMVSNSTSSGYMNMYRGARESVNTYFAQLEKDAGLCNVVRMAESMGIHVPHDTSAGGLNNQVPSFTLGVTSVSPLEMAAAYASAAGKGMYCKPLPVSRIVDVQGNVIKKYTPDCKRVMPEVVANQINDILRGLQEPGGFGYAHGTALRIPSAAKTGTTQENKSVWYVGYTPQLATAAMIAGANGEGVPIRLDGQTINGQYVSFAQAAGSALAGPMWAAAMQVIQNYLDNVPFGAPPQRQPSNPKDPKDKKDENGSGSQGSGSKSTGHSNGNGSDGGNGSHGGSRWRGR